VNKPDEDAPPGEGSISASAAVFHSAEIRIIHVIRVQTSFSGPGDQSPPPGGIRVICIIRAIRVPRASRL
jgi:hypothetical protein